jgi:group II intron reverse transcriptase/maturase
MIGTCLSFLIRIELGSPGTQILANDTQLYNTIITAHAFIMSAPMCLFFRLFSVMKTLDYLYQVKDSQTGGIELYEETQTVKLTIKDEAGTRVVVLVSSSTIRYILIRLTNLSHTIRHRRDLKFIYHLDFRIISIYGIMNVNVEIDKLWNITQSEKKSMQGSKHSKPKIGTLGSSKGTFSRVPNNLILHQGLNILFREDGIIIVRNLVGRMVVCNQGIRKYSSKADLSNQVKRGSELNYIPEPDFKEINIKKISNLKNLVLAYENIKSKPGSMTGISLDSLNNITLDGINLNYLKSIQKKLRGGKYKFPPAKRIYIPKHGKNETRPLTIASPRDKIVQKALQQVMEEEYEKIFLNTSHGFRQGRGTYTAIRYLDSHFQSSHYIIEADFSKAFDSIQHKSLIELIKRNCKCIKTLQLIKSSLKAGYVEFGVLHNKLEFGTAQGSVLSPLLCNIYLHELDKFVEELKREYCKGEKRKRNKLYESISNKVKYMRKKGTNKVKPEKYKELMKQLLLTPSVRNDDSYIRLHYVRYADDFVLGIEGSYKVSKEILGKLRDFIEKVLKLKLNDDKTGIIKYSKKPFKFLGYTIMSPHLKGISKPVERIKEINSGRIITRRKKIRIRFAMNTDKILDSLETEGFIRKRTSRYNRNKLEYRGTFRGNLVNLDHADILMYYNSKINGIYNYYNFVGNMNQVARIM